MEATALESVDDLTPEWTTAVLAQNGIAASVWRVLPCRSATHKWGRVIGYSLATAPVMDLTRLASSRESGINLVPFPSWG